MNHLVKNGGRGMNNAVKQIWTYGLDDYWNCWTWASTNRILFELDYGRALFAACTKLCWTGCEQSWWALDEEGIKLLGNSPGICWRFYLPLSGLISFLCSPQSLNWWAPEEMTTGFIYISPFPDFFGHGFPIKTGVEEHRKYSLFYCMYHIRENVHLKNSSFCLRQRPQV